MTPIINVTNEELALIGKLRTCTEALDDMTEQRNDWIRANGRGGWVDNLRNRVEALSIERDALKQWIREEGVRNLTCTKNILREVCSNCECGKAKS